MFLEMLFEINNNRIIFLCAQIIELKQLRQFLGLFIRDEICEIIVF